MNRKMIALVYSVILIMFLSASAVRAQNLLNNPESVVFDSLNSRYLVSNWGDGAIIQMDSEGKQSYFSTALMGRYRMAGLYIVEDTLLAAVGDAPDAGLAGFLLDSGELLFTIIIPDVGLPNDIVSDKNGVVYVTDYWGDKLYRIIDHAPALMIDEGLEYPNGLIYDAENHRLLVLSVMGTGSPIIAVNLDDHSLSTVVTTGFYGTDGITRDDAGYVYVSEWENDSIYRYDGTFSMPSELFSTGHDDPADIYYDSVHRVLAVPNFSANTVDFVEVITSVTDLEGQNLPEKVQIHQNYPNPFNSQTTISFDLDQPTTITLSIFDVQGKRIRTLVANRLYGMGSHQIRWDAKDDQGRPVSTGIYIYRFTSRDRIETRKMILSL